MQFLKSLFSISVFLLSIAQFSAIIKSGDTNIYAFDLAVLVFVLYGLFYFLAIRKQFVLPALSVLFLSFTLVAILSLLRVSYVYNNYELLVSGFYLSRWIIYLSAGMITYNAIRQNIFDKNYLVSTFVNSGLMISIFGFIQLFIFPDLSILEESLGWDPHKYRLFSTFLDPNFVGAYLTMVLVLLLDKYYLSRNELDTHKFYLGDFISFIIILLGLFLTFSRSAWLMFSLVILIYGLFKSKALLLTFVIIAFAAYFAVPRIQTRIAGITDPADSAQFRFISWSNTWDIAKDNLLLGVGFNAFRYVQKDYGLVDFDSVDSHSASGADSSLLFILATTGIFGLLFFLSGFFYSFVDSKNLVIKSFILGLLMNSLFINSLFYPQILFFLIVTMFSYSIFDI